MTLIIEAVTERWQNYRACLNEAGHVGVDTRRSSRHGDTKGSADTLMAGHVLYDRSYRWLVCYVLRQSSSAAAGAADASSSTVVSVEKIRADIFTYDKRDYLLVVDYFSKFPFILLLPGKSASSVINMLKSLYAIYGTPLTLFADNIPFASQLKRQFASNWNFEIVTSSPQYPRSNGQSERCIQTVKLLLKKAEESRTDPHVAPY